MAKLIFKLKSVFDDEADEVKNLLTENKIDFYESPAGNWGISMHALWLNDETQYDIAKELIDSYQIERSHRIKQEVQQQKEKGEYPTFYQWVVYNPIKFLGSIALVTFVLYVSIMPFLGIGQ